MVGATTAEALERPDVRQALADGNWTVPLRAFQDAGLSQTRIAESTGLSQSQISRLARGTSRRPGLDTVRALCDGLGIPRRMVGLADEEDDTERRQFLTSTVGALGVAALPARSDVGDDELLRATTATYRRLEQRTPTRLMLSAAVSHANLVLQLAQRSGDGQRSRLFAAASEAAGLAGWLHADLTDSASARRFYRLSVRTARQSGEPLLAVYMQGTLGQYATSIGEAAQGVRLIRDAGARLSKTAPFTARAWLAALEGAALGRLGDRAALRLFDLADRHAERAAHEEPVWPWVFRFDESKIAGQRAIAASRLRMPDVAEASFRVAAVSHSPKQSAAVAVEHARSLSAAGDLQQACRMATTAYDTGRAHGSERVRQAVREFRSELGVNVGDVTNELDERLHTAYLEDDT